MREIEPLMTISIMGFGGSGGPFLLPAFVVNWDADKDGDIQELFNSSLFLLAYGMSMEEIERYEAAAEADATAKEPWHLTKCFFTSRPAEDHEKRLWRDGLAQYAGQEGDKPPICLSAIRPSQHWKGMPASP